MLDNMPGEVCGDFVKLVTLTDEVIAYIDRSDASAIVGLKQH